jgi:hypothetical protein
MKKLLILALIGGAVWWFWGRTMEPARVLQAQLEAIGRQDYATAYTFLSEAAKERVTPDQFREMIQTNPTVDHNYTSEFLDRKITGDRATFVGTIRALGGEKTPATFVVVKQQGRWLVDDFRFPQNARTTD